MLFKSATTVVKIFFVVLFVSLQVISGFGQDNKAARAFRYFNEQNYAAAEPLFESLIEESPESLPLYYYYGASRTENRKYSEHELIQLLNASTNEAPAKINYYLGIQYQALNNWEQAVKSYNSFKQNSTAEEQANLGLDKKIQQCYDKENPFMNLTEMPETYSSLANEEDGTDFFSESNTYVIREIPVEPKAYQKIKTLEFKVNSQITYYSPEHFKTEEGRDSYEEAHDKQLELNAALSKLEMLRSQYQLARSSEEKNRIGQEIIPLETEIYSINEEATQLFVRAERAENNYWENVPNEEIEDFLDELSTYFSINNEHYEQQNTPNNNIEYIDPSILFQDRTEAVNVREERKSDELIYKIQIGAYSRALPSHIDRLFKKLAVLRRIENYTDEKGVVVYTTGNLTNYEDAEKMRLQVKQEGVENPIVVPYYNGKRITLEEVKTNNL